QWPCLSKEDPGTGILYEKGFPGGKGKFLPVEYAAPEPDSDQDFPLVLLSGPTMFHSGSLSVRSPGLSKIQGEGSITVHPADAGKLGLVEGQPVTVASSRAKITARVSVSQRAAPGVVFMPCHFPGANPQELSEGSSRITRVKLSRGESPK
ncbi:MAG TPA: molybdopterin dinucleotide binding domain-containing protein, partial [Candidatus Acidoferrum sp.]|nr:molybdopterin dinucleotide binding domain-containing protein [Candidatus Acidoferrum sp.]